MLKRWKDASIEKDARGFKDSSYNIYDTWRCREFLCFRSPRWKTGFDTLLNGTSGAQVSAGFAPPGAGEASVDWKTETSNQQVINGETTTAHSNQPKEPSTQGTLAEANMPAASITTGMPVADDDLLNHEQKYITFHGIPTAEILETLPEARHVTVGVQEVFFIEDFLPLCIARAPVAASTDDCVVFMTSLG